MSKPSDIPQDVWEAAEKATNDADEAFQDSIDDVHQSLEDAMPKAIEVVARAILNERNNAAKIADEFMLYFESELTKDPKDGPFTLKGAIAASKRISQAIRNGGE